MSASSVHFHRVLSTILALLMVALYTAGCSATLQGEPDRVFSVNQQLDYIRKAFPPPDMSAYLALSESQRRAYRNEYVLGQMYAIDINYDVYENNLTREMQNLNFAASATNIALTSVASQITPPGTKDILTATAAGLTGIKAAYDKDVLIQRTIQIVQSQMRANRAKVASRILSRLGASADAYPLMMAWIDLQAYYKAGTFTDGLVEAGHTIGSEALVAGDARNYVLIEGMPASNDQFAAFRNFIYAGNVDGPIDTGRINYLRSLLSSRTNDVTYYFSDRSPALDGVRRQLLACAERYQTPTACGPGSVIVP